MRSKSKTVFSRRHSIGGSLKRIKRIVTIHLKSDFPFLRAKPKQKNQIFYLRRQPIHGKWGEGKLPFPIFPRHKQSDFQNY
jgi:hypothetical protein